MTKKITPHKGGRTVKKSLDVTPEVNTRLYHLKEKCNISLGDLVEWAVDVKFSTVPMLNLDLRVPGIYSITNLLTGKIYIGSTKNIYRRLNHHRCELKNGNCCNKELQRDFSSAKLTDFEFKPVEFVSVPQLGDREIHWTNWAHTQPAGCYNRKKPVPRSTKAKEI